MSTETPPDPHASTNDRSSATAPTGSLDRNRAADPAETAAAGSGDSAPAPSTRSIELDIVVPGTPDQVWQAIATGPGISSWFVPHQVEHREGGAATASFGPAPEMQVTGRVATWDPPHRFATDAGEGSDGLAFEWLVEARGQGTCVVRLVNSGYGTGAEWDDQFDGMTEGWRLFMLNLRLHLEHFRGQHAASMLPTGSLRGPRDRGWSTLTHALGITRLPETGDRLTVAAAGAPALAGTVAGTTPAAISLLLEEPAPGTGFITVEGSGEQVEASVWSYLYGPDAGAVVAQDEPRWREWLAALD